MTADLDTLLTALYVELTDRIIPLRGPGRRGPGRPGSRPWTSSMTWTTPTPARSAPNSPARPPPAPPARRNITARASRWAGLIRK